MRPIRFGQTVISCDTRYLSTLERMVYDAQFLRDYRGFNITTDNSDERMFRVTINPPLARQRMRRFKSNYDKKRRV